MIEHFKIFDSYRIYPLKLDKCSHSPITPGVYLIYYENNNKLNLHYIGCSKNLRSRLDGHSKVYQVRNMGFNAIVYVIPLPIDDIRLVEKFLITELKPLNNVAHNRGGR